MRTAPATVYFFAFLTTILVRGILPHSAQAGILGDRLILTVNNVPYSQLQIEGLLNVKEALREDAAKSSQLVDAKNWASALAAFMVDMVIYQEATKSSGYRPPQETLRKSMDRVRNTLSGSARFQTRFSELGIDDATIREHLSRILTIENLRKSRLGAASTKQGATPTVSWEEELKKAAIVRWFDGGQTYEDIHPKI